MHCVPLQKSDPSWIALNILKTILRLFTYLLWTFAFDQSVAITFTPRNFPFCMLFGVGRVCLFCYTIHIEVLLHVAVYVPPFQRKVVSYVFFKFVPLPGGDDAIWLHNIFEMGWNHQHPPTIFLLYKLQNTAPPRPFRIACAGAPWFERRCLRLFPSVNWIPKNARRPYQ